MTHPDAYQTLAQVLSQAERSLVRRLGERLHAHGSTIEQWRVLTLLADGRGHPMKEIAEFALVPAPTLTRIIDKMITSSLVYRRVDSEDRRRVLIFASARGRRLYDRLQQDIRGYETELAASDAGFDMERLTEMLSKLGELTDIVEHTD